MSNGSLDNKTSMNGTQTPELQTPAPGATSTTATTNAKKRRTSDDLTQSSKTPNPRSNGVLSRTQSEISENQSRKKRKTTETIAEPADQLQPPELTDASTAPNSPEQLPEVEGSHVLPTNDAPTKTGRRLPGRRRQPHPDVNIEADLRRQLNLKMSYRSLAKVQKSLLEELSNRTLNNLQKDEDYHKKCPEYEPLMAQLKERRDGRVDQIDATRTYRLEQSDRVRVAEERIQQEQYIVSCLTTFHTVLANQNQNRFEDLRDDFLLQCYHRMKRIEREMKGEEANATDDEDNVLPPTYVDEPDHNLEERLGSKYASRSRAYVEADKELEEDATRKRFDLARTAFVEEDEDADDTIEDTTGFFTRFVGPDREEAIAHYNLTAMVDAAFELERTPTPQPIAPKIETISNAQAFDLMMLAELSAQHAHNADAERPQTSHHPSQPQQAQQYRPMTPPINMELHRQSSPMLAPISLPSQAAHSSPLKVNQSTPHASQRTPHSEPADITETAKNATPARVSTHRIMDMLNNDQDMPVFKSRESQPSLPHEPSTPSQREAIPSQHNTPAGSVRPTEGADKPVDQALMDALGGRPSEPPSPPQLPMDDSYDSQPPTNGTYNMSTAGPSRVAGDPGRRRDPRDPLQKIRDLLDRKAREHGREPPDRSSPAYWKATESPRNTFLPRVSSMQAAQDRHQEVGYDPTRPAAGLYGVPATVAGPAYPPARRESQDRGVTQWERDRRRLSESQAAPNQSPYSNHAQSQPAEQHGTGPTPPTHHSPYALSPGSLALPRKPPGPPPVNFRFAHYDPAPSRQPYPPQSPTTFPPAPLGLPPPQPYATPTYPPPYPPSYVPPPGSFQAPPPPSSALTPYPPLKIHQYGGQPILPANMAPLPPQQQGEVYGYSVPQTAPQRYEGQGGERAQDPQTRPRRQYRSYHAPGTQFRNYNGPSDGGGRRRGG